MEAKEKYYFEITYTYSNYRWIINFTWSDKILTKTNLNEVKEYINSFYTKEMWENLMIMNIVTVLNK